MKNHIKGGVKVFTGYAISLLVFVIFIYVFLGITRDSFYTWLPLYSFLMFLLMFAIIYSDLKRLAIKEKRPQYNLNPYPLKGFVLGVIGFLPIILIELIYPLVQLEGEVLNNIKHKVLNTFMGPLYFIIRIGKSTTVSYAVASLVVPVISMLAYLAGYYGFELRSYLNKLSKKEPTDTKPKFTKSPWNPTANVNMNKKAPKKRQNKQNTQKS